MLKKISHINLLIKGIIFFIVIFAIRKETQLESLFEFNTVWSVLQSYFVLLGFSIKHFPGKIFLFLSLEYEPTID